MSVRSDDFQSSHKAPFLLFFFNVYAFVTACGQSLYSIRHCTVLCFMRYCHLPLEQRWGPALHTCWESKQISVRLGRNI